MAANVVIAYNTLKEQLAKEQDAKKNWRRKWGIYLKEGEIISEEIDRMGLTKEEFLRRLSFKKPHHRHDDVGWDIKPSDRVPSTSSGIIGWRSNLKYSLERVGPLFVSPQHTLPKEPKQNYIILG